MIPHLDIKIRMCSSLSMHRQCFVASRHHVMIGCTWIHEHISGVRQLHTRILRFLLGEPSMYRHGLGKWTERLSMSHMFWYDDHLMLAFEATPTHVMIGLGVVDLVHVITKKTWGMSFLSGSSLVIWIIRTQFVMNLVPDCILLVYVRL